MSIKTLCSLVASVSILFASYLSAAETYTLKQAMTEAGDSHPLVLGKLAEQEAAEAVADGAEWGRYPTPTLESAGDSDDLTTVFRVDQPLWTGGRITGEIDSANYRTSAAIAGVEEARLEIQLRVLEAYTGALSQRNKLVHAQTGVINHQQLLEMMTRRVNQEVSSQADLRLAQSRLLQAQTDVAVIEQSYDTALVSLRQLVDADISGVASLNLAGIDLGPVEPLLETAEKFAPILQRLSMEIAAAGKDIDTAKSVMMPQVIARYEHTNTKDLTDNRFMVVLQAQPGAGLSAMSNVRSSAAIKRSLEDARASARRELRQRILADYTTWRAAEARLMSARSASEISQQVFESYKRQYVTGRKTWIDVLNATREMTQARLSFEDVRSQSLVAKLRLLANSGQLLENLSD